MSEINFVGKIRYEDLTETGSEQKSKPLLQKFQKLLPKILDVLDECLLKVLIFVFHNNS